MHEALILIDIQNIYFAVGEYKLYEPERAARKAAAVLEKFRKKKKPVIHVRHLFEVEYMEDKQYLLDFNQCVMPDKKEIIVSKKYPSAFLKTNLKKHLDKLKINKLVICGMMTHMCIDTTVRTAQDYGYKVKLIEDACTTKDLKWDGKVIKAQTVHDSIMASLQGAFAEVISCEDFMEQV